MTFLQIYLIALLTIISLMSLLWLLSVYLKNVSIVDFFWGLGFIVCASVYFYFAKGFETRKLLLLILVSVWGLRLSFYLGWRNFGKGEDFRYQEFRRTYGEHRYWWISFFQTFLLQGVLMWLISAPLLAAFYYNKNNSLNIIDYLAIIFWIIGFAFEAGGDFQLATFKSNPANKGKVLNTGFWKYTRHPNYFGDAAVWWSYALFCIASGSYIPVLGSILMTALIIKVSGVALLEKTLKVNKPEYDTYIKQTSSFFPWFPKKTI